MCTRTEGDSEFSGYVESVGADKQGDTANEFSGYVESVCEMRGTASSGGVEGAQAHRGGQQVQSVYGEGDTCRGVVRANRGGQVWRGRKTDRGRQRGQGVWRETGGGGKGGMAQGTQAISTCKLHSWSGFLGFHGIRSVCSPTSCS